MPDYRRRVGREKVAIGLDVNGMMSDAIGDEGFRVEEVDDLQARVSEVARTLASCRQNGDLGFWELPSRTDFSKASAALASQVREEVETLVVLGIGGSALGTRTIVNALGSSRVRVVVADNIDPWSFGALLDQLDLKRTAFNVISKSGETAETMAQFLIVRDRLLRTLGAVDYKKHLIITTDARHGQLRQIVNDEGFRDLVVPDGVGGRFSVLTPVGLFPAAVAGVRVEDLLAGAAAMEKRCHEADLWSNPAQLFGALLHQAQTRRKRDIVVLMPYSDRLVGLSAWFAQLWAESLGKARDREGREVHVGQTPQAAVGATDQHSQLQLYREGPNDKVIVMIRVEDHGRETEIPAAYADLEGVHYLGGNRLGGLLNMEQRATELALQKSRRMVMTLRVPLVNAYTLGQLFFLFEVATVVAGGLYGINSLDQPAVEEGKQLTYGLAGRRGWEERRAEVEEWLAGKQERFIL